MNGTQFRPGYFLIIVFHVTVSFFGGLMLLSGCAAIHETEVSVIRQPKVTIKNKFSSGDSGTGQVTLTWINVLHANWYNIYVSKKPEAKMTGKRISFVETNPVAITDLELGTTYYFVVTAESAEGESESSEEITYTVR